MSLENKSTFVRKLIHSKMFAPHKMKVVLALLFMVYFGFVNAQEPNPNANMIKYTPDFKFKEGVFLNFDQVKRNDPIDKSRIITDIAYDNPDFFDMVLKEKKLQLFDNVGARQEIQTKNIWGFGRNGVLYININDNYFRITIIGNICHFVASLTNYGSDRYNPYYGYGYPYYYSPYYSPYYSTN